MIPMLVVVCAFVVIGIRVRRLWVAAVAEQEEERTDRIIWDADPLLARELGIMERPGRKQKPPPPPAPPQWLDPGMRA